MIINRSLDITRVAGSDAYQILLFEYIDDERWSAENLDLSLRCRVLTDAGWQDFDTLAFDDLPKNLPTISGKDLGKPARRFRRRLTRKRFTQLMRELSE